MHGIDHVSDTARWVAVYRAMESERDDALFRDPFARRLAGARGEAIVETVPRGRAMAWSMIVRTAVFDEMILERVADGADLVLNLAAGLDARPWRLPLPGTLRWIDVDLPGILEEKGHALAEESPVCRYESVAADLADGEARRALLARLLAGSRQALVVSEGLLIYLVPEAVAALARDLAEAGARWWITDLANPTLLQWMKKSWGKATEAAPFRFAPANGTGFFHPYGWREAGFRSTVEEARRLHREMRLMWLWRFLGRFANAERKEAFRTMSGQVLLERTP